MYVITADQIDSRSNDDAAADTLERIGSAFSAELALPPDRTAGDEIQAITGHAGAAYRLVLALTRDGRWSVGLGVGPVREPLGESTRASTGHAFFAARAAIDAAKRTPGRFALRVGAEGDAGTDDSATERADLRAADVEALMTLVLVLREKRSDKGWEVHDLLEAGATQSEAARALGISQGAVSMRARAGSSREEFAASEAVVRLLATLHARTMEG